MPVVSSNNQTGFTITAIEPLVVLASGSITSPSAGVTGVGSGNFFSIYGVFDGANFDTSYSARLVIGSTGSVNVRVSDGLRLGYQAVNPALSDGSNTATISGMLTGPGTAMTVYGNMNTITVNAAGSISGVTKGVNFLGLNLNVLINAGGISATNDNAIEAAGALKLTNTGTITGGWQGVHAHELYEIRNFGTISGLSDGVFVDTSTGGTFVNAGTVASSATGANLSGGFLLINNSGQIIGSGAKGLLVIGDGAGIGNTGTIQGLTNGVEINGTNYQFSNSGQVLSSVDVGFLSSGSGFGSNSIINSGTIQGTYAMSLGGNSNFTINNDGTMQGSINGLAANVNGTLYLANSGTISGKFWALYLASAATTVENSGLIRGDVFLSSGSDSFANIGGTVTGTVFGGDGSDVYVVDRTDLKISESIGLPAEVDSVSSSVNWTLGDNFENLSLTGFLDLRGTGNGLGNTIQGNVGDNRLSGLAGNDSILGDQGDDTILGGAGLDTLNGGDGDDRLLGGAGNDSIQGNDGFDTIVGGAGRDTLSGGLDADVFVFDKGETTAVQATADFITDYAIGVDRIDISAIDAVASTTANEAFTFIGGAAFTAAGQVHVIVNAAKTYVELEWTGDNVADAVIRLNSAATLTAADFVL